MIFLIAEILRVVPDEMRLLGLDIGAKTIGLAISDPGLAVASPVETIRRGKRFAEDAKALLELIDGRGVGGLILGLPLNMDGTEGPRCQSVRAFAENLLKIRDLPLAFWDERLSTAAINRFLIDEADMSRKRRSQVVDKMAAAYILQGALDAMREGAGSDFPSPSMGEG
jgi:putative Holliday junction resolvase